MKPQIDLEKAAEAEAFGALAVRSGREPKVANPTASRFTAAQGRALSELARSFFRIAKEAGAEKQPVVLGDVSFELRENGSDEVLSIRTSAAT